MRLRSIDKYIQYSFVLCVLGDEDFILSKERDFVFLGKYIDVEQSD